MTVRDSVARGEIRTSEFEGAELQQWRLVEREVAMVKKATRTTRSRGATKRRPQPEVLDEEERILRAATIHLITKHGMFLVATGARKARIKGLRVWIITVTLRYTTGHEGYVGDLLYDGKDFIFLTEKAVMDERVHKIATDPERQREWDEYRATAL